MAVNNHGILDKINYGTSASSSGGSFGYNASLPNGQTVWIGCQADLDKFLQDTASQGGADGYTRVRDQTYADIERSLRC